MRPALLLAAVLAGAPTAAFAAAPAQSASAAAGVAAHDADQASVDKTALDIRCVVVGGALSQSDDANLQNLGRASLFYFLGRLEGRGDTDNLAARVVDAATKMTADDINAEAKTCGAMFTAATQSLQDISNTFQQRLGAPTSGGPTAPSH
jgi:hypothetical protein